MRELTPRLTEYVERATKDGLENPLGRAVYAANRMLNTHRHPPDEIMRRCRPQTAETWRAHWERGGCLRTLKRTVDEERAYQEKNRDRNLTDGQKLRRVIRRIRRKVSRGEMEVASGQETEA